MSTENMTDPAQTASSVSAANAAVPSPGAHDAPPGTLKNGWSTPAAASPAEADPTQAAPVQAAPPQAAAAPAEAAAPAVQVAAAPSEESVAAPPAENREQLHRRVQSRIAELTEAGAQLAGQDGNQARARAIETELQVARDAMSGGWDHVGPIEASHLSQWLTNTGNLIVTKPDAEPQS